MKHAEHVALATKIISLLHGRKRWMKPLDESGEKLLVELIVSAGFSSCTIAFGKLKGNYLDQDGSSTGQKYSINTYCPYMVLDKDGDNHYQGTGWLEYAMSLASSQDETTEKIAEALAQEIERSVPMEPIILTEIGDKLCEYPPSGPSCAYGSSEYFVDHTRDDRKFSSCVGIHDLCDCYMDRKAASETHDALSCRGCNLRVAVPKGVETYGDFRAHMAKVLTLQPA